MSTTWLDLPTGRFTMGTDDDAAADDEQPSRAVSVGAMRIGADPVTVAQFARFVEEIGYETVAEREATGFVGAERELTAGADWRRPRGPGSSASADDPVVQLAWIDAYDYCAWGGVRLPTEAEWEYAARAVPGVGELGLWQWCADWYDPDFHRDEQRVNPTGPPNGLRRVARGGGDRVTQRAGFFPDLSADDLGFRVVAVGAAV